MWLLYIQGLIQDGKHLVVVASYLGFYPASMHTIYDYGIIKYGPSGFLVIVLFLDPLILHNNLSFLRGFLSF